MLYNITMKKIGIFGGTFDPPHIEHKKLLRSAAKELALDSVIVVPSGNPPHKDGNYVTPAQNRYDMASLAFQGTDSVSLSDYELKRQSHSYTYQTLEHFQGSGRLYFIVGADSLYQMKEWKHPERILELATIAAAGRGTQIPKKKGYESLHFVGENISSTDIRIMLEFGVEDELPIENEVLNYIRRHGLYRRFTKYVQAVRERIPYERYVHTMNTVMTAEKLNIRHGLKIRFDALFLAAALHDIAKNMERSRAVTLFPEDGVLRECRESVLHQYAGADLAAKLFPELSEEILSAIRYHTTFRKEMSSLEKVVAIADTIEPTRNFAGVNEIRAAVDADLDGGITLYLKRLIENLKERGEEIQHETYEAYQYFAMEGNR